MYKKVKLSERPFVLHVFIGEQPQDIARRLNKIKACTHTFDSDYFKIGNDEDACTFDIGEYLPANFCVVIRNNQFTVEAIAHEAFHCTAMHFRYIGQPLSSNSEESYAYMVGWITSIIYHMIYEQNTHA